MFKKILLTTLLGVSIYGSTLSDASGSVTTKTELFGAINVIPEPNQIKSKLSFNGNIEAMRGKIFVDSQTLILDNLDQAFITNLNIQNCKEILFNIKTIEKLKENQYNLVGDLTVNAVTKPFKIPSNIIKISDRELKIDSSFAIKMSEFNIRLPEFLIATTDLIHISSSLKFK